MSCRCDMIGETGLQFYGKMTASMSHEIKNVLAIINENAGLLEDFTLMADRGMPIDAGRLKTLAGKVIKQVERADGIVKTMNRFAHSIDESVKNVELDETLKFVATLFGRLAFVRGVTLEVEPGASPVTIATRSFFLENLVWLCLDFAMDATGGGKTVGLRAEQTENGARLKLTQLQGLSERTTSAFPGERETALLDALRAELAINVRAAEIVLILPRDIGQ